MCEDYLFLTIAVTVQRGTFENFEEHSGTVRLSGLVIMQTLVMFNSVFKLAGVSFLEPWCP